MICPLNLIQSDHLRSLTQHDVPACSLSQDCRVNTASGLQHSVEDVKVGKFDLIFAHPEALFNTMEEKALLFDKAFQKLITAVVVIQSGHGNLDFVCQSSLCAHWRSHERSLHINTLRPKQKGCHFADNFKCIFLNENVWISIKIWFLWAQLTVFQHWFR